MEESVYKAAVTDAERAVRKLMKAQQRRVAA
jgi:hypothetical protein